MMIFDESVNSRRSYTPNNSTNKKSTGKENEMNACLFFLIKTKE